MNILVTGGAGFIGSHTVDKLISKGYAVKVLDNLQKPVHLKGKPDYINQKAELILSEFYDKAQQVTGKRVKPVRFGDARHIFSDISKLKSFGWTPKISTEESIKEYWDYLNKQNDIDDILDYAEKTMKTKSVQMCYH